MPIFRLQVLTPERTVISTEVEYVELPGTEGTFGICAGMRR